MLGELVRGKAPHRHRHLPAVVAHLEGQLTALVHLAVRAPPEAQEAQALPVDAVAHGVEAAGAGVDLAVARFCV